MAENKNGKTELALQFVEKYISLAQKHNTSYSKRFISENLYAENPDIYKDFEDARYFVRRVTGSTGNKYTKYEDVTRSFATMEQSAVECVIENYVVGKQYKKAFVIADIHSRFMNRNAVEIAINYAIKQGCDICIIDGDLFDFYQFSRFDKNPNIMQYFFSERELVIDLLSLLQRLFGKVVFKMGNHDLRRELYLNKLSDKAPEIQGLTYISDYCFFDGSTVDVVKDYNIIQLGKLNIMHGHEYYGGGGIHVAYNRLQKVFDNVMSAHSHTTQTVFKKDINDVMYGSWALGCLCDLNQRYNPKNNQNHGFAIVEVETSGDFIVQNKMIINGKIF